MSIGNNVRLIRMQRGLTLDQLADKLVDCGYPPLSSTTIGRWERGQAPVPSQAIVPLSMALQCSTNAILYVRSAKDVEGLQVLSERQRAIIRYLRNTWSGNVNALLQCGYMYAHIPPDVRQEAAYAVMRLYMQCLKNGTLLEGHEDVDYQTVHGAWKKMNK